MFSPNPAPSTAGSGYTRARTPQGGMTQTALSAMFPTATTTEGLTATEVASQTKHQKSCHRSRHVLRRYFKVRELQAMGEVEVVYCPTDSNWSDFLTKVVPKLPKACTCPLKLKPPKG